ncbi:MAG: hypothetical protein KUG79_00430 [Pseudomonadales bacterium]|nr:hypothetical protein [Pseudomonadales bacterium]
MNKKIQQLRTSVSLIEKTISELSILNEAGISSSLSFIKIQLDAMEFHTTDGVRLNTQPVVKGLLLKIYFERISHDLEALVQTVYGYYALVNVPTGSNEPPVGPTEFHSRITFTQLHRDNPVRIKDQLYQQLAHNKNGKPSRQDG